MKKVLFAYKNELNANEQKFWHCTKLDAGNLVLVVYLNGIFADVFFSIQFEDIHFICLFGIFSLFISNNLTFKEGT